MLSRIKAALYLIKSGQLSIFFSVLRGYIYSDAVFLGVRRDLTQPFETPAAKIPLTIRPIEPDDIPKLFDMNAPSITGKGAYLLKRRRLFLDENVPTCYIAVTKDNMPCYLQWLMGPDANDKIQSYFKGMFPRLAPDEALLEYAYTPEAFQRKRIMPCAVAQIAEKAQDFGARWVIAFVDYDNIPALKGCKRAGFTPYMELRRKRRLFRQQVTHTLLPKGTPFPFDT